MGSDARQAILDTLAAYCQLCDDGRFDEWADLFEPDAAFVVLGRTRTGRDEIRDFMEVAQREELRGRHMISEPRIVLAPDGRRASAWTDYVFVDRSPAITSVGRYHDELRLGDDGRWRFRTREIVFRGDEPGATQPPPG